MIISISTKNKMLDAILVNLVKLHISDPGEFGVDNEVSSVSYLPQSCIFNAAINGVRALSTDLTFSMSGGDTVRFVTYWDGDEFALSNKTDDFDYSAAGLLTLKAAATDLRL